MMTYKDFDGSAEIDVDSNICFGKLMFIDDLVAYTAPTPSKLRKAFEEAVDDYLEMCAELKRAPQKPCRGVFQTRLPPELHRAATRRATTESISLNELMTRAVREFLKSVAPHAEAAAVSAYGGVWVQTGEVRDLAAGRFRNLRPIGTTMQSVERNDNWSDAALPLRTASGRPS